MIITLEVFSFMILATGKRAGKDDGITQPYSINSSQRNPEMFDNLMACLTTPVPWTVRSNPQPKRDKVTVPSAWAFQMDKVFLVPGDANH